MNCTRSEISEETFLLQSAAVSLEVVGLQKKDAKQALRKKEKSWRKVSLAGEPAGGSFGDIITFFGFFFPVSYPFQVENQRLIGRN